MRWLVGHGLVEQGSYVQSDVPAALHAVPAGSPVAACGAPVGDVTEQPWPPPADRCSACEQVVASQVS